MLRIRTALRAVVLIACGGCALWGVLVVASVPSTAAAIGPAGLQARLAAELSKGGGRAGAYVYDASTSTPLFAAAATTPRIPASVEKLYTTSTALLRFGPSATLDTTVLATTAPDAAGAVGGDIYLRGAGDPTFGTAHIGALVGALRRAGVREIRGGVLGDESLFDRLRGAPASGYALDLVDIGDLSALAFDRGDITGSAHGPAYRAAYVLAGALRRAGVHVLGATGTGVTPAIATPLASVPSPPLSAIAALTNAPSDNFFAETLAKDVGAYFGGGGSTSAGVAVIRTQAHAFGLHPAIVDGSGLSRADRTTALDVVGLLVQMRALQTGGGAARSVTPSGAGGAGVTSYPAPGNPGQAFFDSLAVAGRTGTLAHRMRSSAARDRCHAKTGTLNGVSSLAGYCQAVGGHTLAFAILINGARLSAAHAAQDRMAATIAGY